MLKYQSIPTHLHVALFFQCITPSGFFPLMSVRVQRALILQGITSTCVLVCQGCPDRMHNIMVSWHFITLSWHIVPKLQWSSLVVCFVKVFPCGSTPLLLPMVVDFSFLSSFFGVQFSKCAYIIQIFFCWAWEIKRKVIKS